VFIPKSEYSGTEMSGKIKFNKKELNHTAKSFGYANHEKSSGMVRGKSEFDPLALSGQEQASMKKLLMDSGRADDLLILNKKK
jgi:hypothetical protein